MYEVAKAAGYLAAPLTVVLGLAAAATMLLLLKRARWAGWLGAAAFALLWLASTPWLAQVLFEDLESHYPSLTPEATPAGDAILVLGGALSAARPPRRPGFVMGPASARIWHAAALYKAGKARWVIVAAGNQPGQEQLQPEAQAIAEMLAALGVPREAMRLESTSRNTRENAERVRPLVDEIGARRLLVVTSAAHMPRALKTIEKAWAAEPVELVPAATDFRGADPPSGLQLWFPSAFALANVTSGLKEYAGSLALAMM